ncbi:hypothetical protein M3Y94_00031900 [Aphelenchoides besseyi]|nr:hypothetical protein M3Y94_00031900 [Aphelenchoides besseyi]
MIMAKTIFVLFFVFLAHFATAQLNNAEVGIPIQTPLVHDEVVATSEEREEEKERARRIVRFIVDRYRRDADLIPILEQLTGIDDDASMDDPRRIKRHQRYGRAGRIGGTIVMGK